MCLFPPIISFTRLAVGNFFFPDDTDSDKAWAVYHNKLEHFQTDLLLSGNSIFATVMGLFLVTPMRTILAQLVLLVKKVSSLNL